MFNLATSKETKFNIIKGEIIIFIGAMVKFIGELFYYSDENLTNLVLQTIRKHLLGMSTVNFIAFG